MQEFDSYRLPRSCVKHEKKVENNPTLELWKEKTNSQEKQKMPAAEIVRF
jgi:hypothetical protein